MNKNWIILGLLALGVLFVLPQMTKTGSFTPPPPSGSCTLLNGQTLSIGYFDADKPTTAQTATVKYVYEADGKTLHVGNTSTNPLTAYQVYATGSNVCADLETKNTVCSATDSISLSGKSVDTSVGITNYNTNGITANSVLNNLTIGTGASATLHAKLTQSANYKHLSCKTNQFAVFLNITNATDFDSTQMSASFDGQPCTQYTGVRPSSLAAGGFFVGYVCNGDFAAVDGSTHDLAVKIQAASGINPCDQGATLSLLPMDYYQNTISGALSQPAPVKNDGSAIQTVQSSTFYIG